MFAASNNQFRCDQASRILVLKGTIEPSPPQGRGNALTITVHSCEIERGYTHVIAHTPFLNFGSGRNLRQP